jgi:hypothetical protein
MAQQLQKKFIGNNQVDGTKILLENGQSIKIKDSTGTEVELVKLGASDEVLVKGQEVALKSELTQEIADRISGDASTLSSAEAYTDGEVSSLSASVTASISAEESARIAADAVLQGNIDGNFTTLDNYISGVEDNLAQEVSDRIAGDANLQSQIDAISGGGSGSISALQAELDATQQGAGLNADGTYPGMPMSNYLAPAMSLFGAISALDIFLKSEETARIAADANLQTQIDNVLSNVDPGALDSLTEIVTAFQAADASLNGAITSLSTGLSADIDAEEAARIAADQALQGEIDAEEVARAAADVTLQNNINAEASARQSADDALDARVDVLESVVWFKEKFSISNGQTSVTLSHVPENKSMSAWVDRLAIHEGASEDFTVSGTSMTFLNDLVSPGNSQIGNGDTVYVKYQYKV